MSVIVHCQILALLSNRTAYTYRLPRSPDLLAKYRPDYVILDSHSAPHFVQQFTQRAQRLLMVSIDSGVHIPVCQIGLGK